MNQLHVVSSGSKANAFIVESDGAMLLIDQGLSYREFCRRCELLDIDTAKIQAILLTHEHSDHAKGIPYTAHRLNVPVFSMEKTLRFVADSCKYDLDLRFLDVDNEFSVGGFFFTPFDIMHDAVNPIGFTISMKNERLCFATDTGKVTNRMMSYINECDHIILEANHDHSMLYRNKKYPPQLKERIRGPKGHLSNDQCFETIERIAGKCPKTIIFSHLSQENNCPELLLTMVNDFRNRNTMVFNSFIADQTKPFSVLLT
jgi:phosphoribosyl 1,2-cyclic phosphodiesterase